MPLLTHYFPNYVWHLLYLMGSQVISEEEPVCGVIHKAAGPELAIYGKRFAPLKLGEAVLTPGFNLKVHYVIHVCAPKYHLDQDAERLLGICLWSGLKLAEENGLKRIALPAVGTGINGFPKNKARKIFEKVASEFKKREVLQEIRYIVFGDDKNLLW